VDDDSHADPATLGAVLVADPAAPQPATGDPGAYVYEPVGAVTRSGALPVLAATLHAWRLHPDLAYLSADRLTETPFATVFAVSETFGYREQELRAWVRNRGIGTLEILTRGLDLDPAVLRRRLRPSGPGRATLVITRTPRGKTVLVVDRLPGGAR
jgi:THUMP domain-containing protein